MRKGEIFAARPLRYGFEEERNRGRQSYTYNLLNQNQNCPVVLQYPAIMYDCHTSNVKSLLFLIYKVRQPRGIYTVWKF